MDAIEKEMELKIEGYQKLAKERREKGSKVYGEGTFMESNLTEEFKLEIIDSVNYLFFALAKIELSLKKAEEKINS